MRSRKICIHFISAFLAIIMLSVFSPMITAKALIREPRLNFKTLSATRNITYRLNVYNMQPDQHVTFSSSNTDVVLIKKPKVKSCKLKAKATGTSIITVEVSDNEDNIVTVLKCRVKVSPSAISIKFSKHKIKLTEGQTKTVKAIIKPNISSEQPKYSSDNPEIATVSSMGTVTAVSEGETIIRATIANGKEAFYTVIVEPDNSQDEPSEEDEPTPTPASSSSRFNKNNPIKDNPYDI